jgi:FkbM family methyltransferase
MTEWANLARRIAHRIAPPIVIDAVRAAKKAVRSRRAPVEDGKGSRTVVSGILAGTRLNLPSGAGEEWADAILHGTFEPIVRQAMEANVHQGWKCFDIGGHIGYYSLVLAHLTGPDGEVHCFEPFPRNATRIREHMAANGLTGRVHIHELAVADRTGSAVMVAGGGADGRSSMAHLEDARGVLGEWADGVFSTFTRTPVREHTLDELWVNGIIPAPQLVKIDVEGAELKVLMGALGLLRATRPILVAEFHNCRLAVECAQLLTREGYALDVLALPSSGSCFVLATPHATRLRDEKALDVSMASV